MQDTIQKIPIDALLDPDIAMRENVHDEQMDELMADMKSVGLIQPITVRAVGDKFEIIAGHRRTTAARLLGWPTIDAKVVVADDDTAFTMRAMENLSRADVNPVDEACYIGEIIKRHNKSVDDVAGIVHRTPAWVEQRLEIFDMPDYLQNYLRLKQISIGAALILNKISNEASKRYLINYAAQNGVTVAQANRWALSAQSEADNPNVNLQAIATAPDEPAQSITLVRCVRCGEMGPVVDMDTPYVHRGPECPPAKSEAERQ